MSGGKTITIDQESEPPAIPAPPERAVSDTSTPSRFFFATYETKLQTSAASFGNTTICGFTRNKLASLLYSSRVFADVSTSPLKKERISPARLKIGRAS